MLSPSALLQLLMENNIVPEHVLHTSLCQVIGSSSMLQCYNHKYPLHWITHYRRQKGALLGESIYGGLISSSLLYLFAHCICLSFWPRNTTAYLLSYSYFVAQYSTPSLQSALRNFPVPRFRSSIGHSLLFREPLSVRLLLRKIFLP